jgi:hypothetical protein
MNTEPTGEGAGVDYREYYADIGSDAHVRDEYRSLSIAVLLLKVVAVLYVALAFYGMLKAWPEVGSAKDDIPVVLAFIKELFVAFWIWVLASIVKILLDIKRETFRLRSLNALKS